MKSVFLRENKNRDYLRDQKADFFAGRGAAALGGVGRGALPSLGGTQNKGGAFSAECPLNWAGVHSPAGLPGLQAAAARGPHPAPHPRHRGASSPSHRRRAGILGARREAQRCQGSALLFPLMLNRPTAAFSSPHGPLARCSPALLARTGELFPLQRKRGGDTAGTSAVPPSAQDERHGGETRPGGIPNVGCERGAAAFARSPPAVGAVLPERDGAHTHPLRSAAHTHTRVRDTGTGRGTQAPEWGHAGMGHACAGTLRGRGHARVHTRTQSPGSHPSFVNALPQGSGSRGDPLSRVPIPLHLPSPNSSALSLPLPTPPNPLN